MCVCVCVCVGGEGRGGEGRGGEGEEGGEGGETQASMRLQSTVPVIASGLEEHSARAFQGRWPHLWG